MSQPAATGVVDFFDALIRSDLPIQGVCDRTVHFLGRAVGCVDRYGSSTRSFPGRSDGRERGIPSDAVRRRLVSGEEVWLGPYSEGGSVSAVANDVPDGDLLELFATAAKMSLTRGRPWSVTATGVRLSIGGGTLEERREGLQSLGIGLRNPVNLLALAGPEAGRGKIIDELRERTGGALFTAPVGQVTAVIVARDVDLDHLFIPAGNHLGIGGQASAADAPRIWQRACSALRFSQPATRTARDHSVEDAVQLDYDVMQAFAPLADAWTAEKLAELPDVRALDTLIGQEGGEMLRTLDVVAATDSYREAARQLRTHHSTVAGRMVRAEKLLGYSLGENYGRSRLMVGLMMRRLRVTAGLV